MGIKQLMSFLTDRAPKAIQKKPLTSYSDKTIAFDGSLALYQCLVAIQFNSNKTVLTDQYGHITSHLIPIFNRNLSLLEAGVRPIWVFDGTPPKEKAYALNRRRLMKNACERMLFGYPESKKEGLTPKEAIEMKKKRDKNTIIKTEAYFCDRISAIAGEKLPKIYSKDFECKGDSDIEENIRIENIQEILALKEKEGDPNYEKSLKLAKRTLRVTDTMVEDAIEMLKMMGVCVIKAPGEAEAQCSSIVNENLAYAVASEDMDSLAFGAPILLRGFKSNKKDYIVEIDFEKVLVELKFSREEFIDFCILLGCDYCSTIEGIGPVRAYELIRTYGKIESVIENLEEPVGPDFEYQKAREIFWYPEVEFKCEIKFTPIKDQVLGDYLIRIRGFHPMTVERGLKRIYNLKKKKKELTLEAFYGIPVKRPMVSPPPIERRKQNLLKNIVKKK